MIRCQQIMGMAETEDNPKKRKADTAPPDGYVCRLCSVPGTFVLMNDELSYTSWAMGTSIMMFSVCILTRTPFQVTGYKCAQPKRLEVRRRKQITCQFRVKTLALKTLSR